MLMTLFCKRKTKLPTAKLKFHSKLAYTAKTNTCNPSQGLAAQSEVQHTNNYSTASPKKKSFCNKSLFVLNGSNLKQIKLKIYFPQKLKVDLTDLGLKGMV